MPPSQEGVSTGSRKFTLLALLLLAFGFRFYFGLHCPAVIVDEDEIQTYLVGLKSFTTHTWPTFGTDMPLDNGEMKGQMAGALEGLLVAVPLWIWPAPESPYLFVNLLSFLALTFLGWYCRKRTPGLPAWFIFGWLWIAPWTTHFSTQVMNQSYALVGAILFIVGFMEAVPTLRLGVLSTSQANFWLGFGFLWMAQLHMSWVLFAPFLLYALWIQSKKETGFPAWGMVFLGALPLLILLIPTYIQYGFTTFRNVQGYSTIFNFSNVLGILDLLGRYLSLACFELPRFIGAHTNERARYLLATPWLEGPGFILWGAGIAQAAGLFLLGFFPKAGHSDWKAVRNLTLAFFLALYVFFWFSAKLPTSYRYYEILPLVMIYSFYCWESLAGKALWRKTGIAFLALALFFQVGYALRNAREGTSVYSRYQDRMARAIEAGDYRLLADRRAGALY